MSTSPTFPVKFYESLYLKNGPIKTYKVRPFSIVKLCFHRSNEENSYKHALLVISRKANYDNLRCVHTMPRRRMQHTAALSRGKSCSAYAANAIMFT